MSILQSLDNGCGKRLCMLAKKDCPSQKLMPLKTLKPLPDVISKYICRHCLHSASSQTEMSTPSSGLKAAQLCHCQTCSLIESPECLWLTVCRRLDRADARTDQYWLIRSLWHCSSTAWLSAPTPTGHQLEQSTNAGLGLCLQPANVDKVSGLQPAIRRRQRRALAYSRQACPAGKKKGFINH